ncbi:glycine--tRNA ligase subunit beta [Cereibacter sphaeroides]|jgi:glycyl-tRNA synthetase beta chain|uniref:Glycine--tRNA ligase beta subunit n=1 Tax=Cereibacter sphaeroides (strain ATCC 17029 / ATH 2.4.9) TaxID=349101 RepID=SYGB_CERS1|nr:RecName: Full=Glycine--tRNA ligase beta subunit; AltName: Full=Glycyl-tRNA synthetase beta subunit; Short=GlyRS [Cereibacter sphaeroides ATCC 17029]ABN75623.1 Glycine--tRNA ligase [Cereibacter sphaeroides ATCC 17029]
MPDLLIELFSEEIPARMQARAREDLKKLVTDGLVEAGLTYASAGAFSTPRRLVLSVEGLSAESPTLREERKGPKADAPAAAIEGFLRSTGLTRDRLETREDKKGAVLFAVVEKPGRPAPEIVAEVLERTIRTFPWPKSMRWGTGSLRWVRPLQSILCLLSDEGGAEVVPMTLDGLTAGNSTEGHRFMAPARFAVSGFEDYRAKLGRAFVMLDASEREQAIWHEATTQAFAQGLEVVPDAALLSEVAGLVEWPVVLMGAIGEDFLGLPPEVLQTSMREHQKFFSVTNPATGRIEKFVTVANRETADHGETILKGNGKVLSARLSDARFFWENDLRTVKTAGLEGMAEGLKQVTFHNRLGSQADRIARIEALAREIAPLVGASPDLAAEAARVAKADLQSAMVGEFPELQGTMGSYYARAAGLPEAVAQACKAHYQPLGPSDAVPTDPVSVAVALADKIDTLAGFWRIGEKPTGSKDPFALRRAALGVIRLLLTNNSRAGLMGIMLPAMNRHLEPFDTSDFTPYERELLSFFHDRLKVHLREQGIRHDVIDACLAMPGNDDLTLLVKRAEALSAFLKTDDGTNLLQGFKRANNILTQAEAKDGVEYSFGADPKFAETDAERALFAALETAEAAIGPALQAEDFAAAMSAMAALRAPIDAFFETVQVNADNAVLRRNRLNMLHSIRATCARVADLTRIEG